MAEPRLTPQELPMAIHWEQVRLHWYQQQGHIKAAEECRKCLERLEACLWDAAGGQ